MRFKNQFHRFMNHRALANGRYKPTCYERAANCYTHALLIVQAIVGSAQLHRLSDDCWGKNSLILVSYMGMRNRRTDTCCPGLGRALGRGGSREGERPSRRHRLPLYSRYSRRQALRRVSGEAAGTLACPRSFALPAPSPRSRRLRL
ncbi:Monocyte To Macrophage Differentiation Factor [Manis pentadactyla]|nr:Monocyte To Macrophage Differentiation Factor [Manis pentadactyla]